MTAVSSLDPPHDDMPRSERPRRDYSRWRAGTLLGVYVLMAVHIAHWKLSGRTLAPLELNEVMYTLELGIVTAGFVFMCVAVLSVLIFGRFFCSWGCHILALEDLCAWLLKKAGVRPKPVRSRVLLIVPFGAMTYMFIWPQLKRVVSGEPLPRLHIASSETWWGSFVTDDFWRNLPDVWIALLTFFVCGFLIVYVLGSRSFCKYVCPYGAVFSLADRLAPGRIVLRGDCSQCGRCTAVCTSHVRVHDEITAFGKVVSPQCLKDLDCVTACPEGAIQYGFTTPSLFKSWTRKGRKIPRADFTWMEEVLIATSFLVAVFVYRGLYMAVPFLLALGIGAILAFGSVLCWRLWTRRDVRLNNFQLRRAGLMTRWGGAFVLLASAIYLLTLHSAFIRYHEMRGDRAFETVRTALADGRRAEALNAAPDAFRHLSYCERIGLFTPLMRYRQLASLAELGSSTSQAEAFLEEIVRRAPEDVEARLRLCGIHIELNRLEEAEMAFRRLIDVAARDPSNVPLRSRLSDLREVLAEALVTRGEDFQAAQLPEVSP